MARVDQVDAVGGAHLHAGAQVQHADLRLAVAGGLRGGAHRLRRRSADAHTRVHRVLALRARGVGDEQGVALAVGGHQAAVQAQLVHLRMGSTGRRDRGRALARDRVAGIQPHGVDGKSEFGAGRRQHQLGRGDGGNRFNHLALGGAGADHGGGVAGAAVGRHGHRFAGFDLALEFGQDSVPGLGHGHRAHRGGVGIGRSNHQVAQGAGNAGQRFAATRRVVVGFVAHLQGVGGAVDGGHATEVEHRGRTGLAAGGERHARAACHRLRRALRVGAHRAVASTGGDQDAAAIEHRAVVGVGMDGAGQRADDAVEVRGTSSHGAERLAAHRHRVGGAALRGDAAEVDDLDTLLHRAGLRRFDVQHGRQGGFVYTRQRDLAVDRFSDVTVDTVNRNGQGLSDGGRGGCAAYDRGVFFTTDVQHHPGKP